ncbi:Integrase core domain-containing protein, partial [Nereida ignava DSM 16309]
PECIRSDNGGEFVAEHLQKWLRKVGVKPIQIYPGSPWENGYNERFNGILRQEVLNAEWFHSIKQAQVAINIWLKEYNHIRPHHALGMRPPMPETLLEKSKISGTEIGARHLYITGILDLLCGMRLKLASVNFILDIRSP